MSCTRRGAAHQLSMEEPHKIERLLAEAAAADRMTNGFADPSEYINLLTQMMNDTRAQLRRHKIPRRARVIPDGRRNRLSGNNVARVRRTESPDRGAR